MKNYRFILLLCLISSSFHACESTQKASAATYGQMIGIVHQGCLAIKNDQLAKGDPLTLIRLDDPQKSFSSLILASLSTEDNCVLLLEDRKVPNLQNGWSFYSIDLSKHSEQELAMSIAIVKGPKRIEAKGNLLGVDLGANGGMVTFSSCSSSEGIHFSAWTGEVVKRKKIWEAYYYLGYDLEVTCLE